MTRILNSLEDTLAFMRDLEDGAPVEDFELGEDFASVNIHVDGPRYHSTVTGELARGLWEFQAELYRAAAFAIKGTDDVRALSTAQRQQFELIFEVHEGSTDLSAIFKDFLVGLAEGFKTMDDRKKVITMLSIVALIVGGAVAWKALDVSADAKKDEVKASLALKTEEEKTKQFELIAQAAARDPVVQRFERAAEEGTKSIVRSAPDATSIRVGRTKFSRSDVQEANQRSARSKSEAMVIEDEYRVFGTESRNDDSTRYVLSGMDGSEFPVTVVHADFAPEDLEKIWAAARRRTRIKLEVSVTKNRGTIRMAQVVSVL